MVKGTHYEKVVCACCFLFLCVNIGFTSTSFNVYQPYIVAVDGIGDTGGSLILAFRTLISLLCMLAVAKWYRLLDCRLGVFLASCLTAIGFFFYSLADNFFMFCLGTVGISVWSIDLSTPEERLGLVKDLQVGYAFGGFIFNLVPGPLMDVLGSYCVSYGILVVLGVICMAIVLGIYVKLVGKSNL